MSQRTVRTRCTYVCLKQETSQLSSTLLYAPQQKTNRATKKPSKKNLGPLTWAVAEVGKTSMWVTDASCGVFNGTELEFSSTWKWKSKYRSLWPQNCTETTEGYLASPYLVYRISENVHRLVKIHRYQARAQDAGSFQRIQYVAHLAHFLQALRSPTQVFLAQQSRPTCQQFFSVWQTKREEKTFRNKSRLCWGQFRSGRTSFQSTFTEALFFFLSTRQPADAPFGLHSKTSVLSLRYDGPTRIKPS